MQQYFAAYKHDLKTLKEIWDRYERSVNWLDFNEFTTKYKNICWTVTNNKITGYCNEEFYKNDNFQEIDLSKETNTIIKASEARKMLNENLDDQIQIVLKDIDLSIKEAIKRLENSIKIDLSKRFCNIVDILEDVGYILSQKEDEDYITLEISW